MRSCSLVLLAFFAAPAVAAGSDADIRFGMVGHLAVDCTAPHGYANRHFTISISPEGRITQSVVQGRSRERSTMRSLRLITPELLEYVSEQLFDSGWTSTATVSVARIDGGFRTWRIVGADGRIFVEDGKTTHVTPLPDKLTHALMVCKS